MEAKALPLGKAHSMVTGHPSKSMSPRACPLIAASLFSKRELRYKLTPSQPLAHTCTTYTMCPVMPFKEAPWEQATMPGNPYQQLSCMSQIVGTTETRTSTGTMQLVRPVMPLYQDSIAQGNCILAGQVFSSLWQPGISRLWGCRILWF